MRVAVVGAGIMGACAARALAERGHRVTLLEQFDLNHRQGSSHGHSRIIRKAYPDPLYAKIMDEAYGLWGELQAFSDRQILFEPGLLYYGSFESQNLRDVLTSLQEIGADHELLDDVQSRERFPDLRLEPGEIGIFTPEAGWVHAERALDACLQRFRDLGGTVRENAKAEIDLIETEFDRYVLCPGPWIRDFVEAPVTVTLQTFGYVERTDSRPVDGPVWIEDGEEIFYGFPSEPGDACFKIGVHRQGRIIDPSEPDRTPDPTVSKAIEAIALRRFRAKGCTFSGCLYTNAPDEDFLLGRHGEDGFFCSACSGHGFKFAPWIGGKLADFSEEKDAPENHPRFCWPKPLKEA